MKNFQKNAELKIAEFLSVCVPEIGNTHVFDFLTAVEMAGYFPLDYASEKGVKAIQKWGECMLVYGISICQSKDTCYYIPGKSSSVLAQQLSDYLK